MKRISIAIAALLPLVAVSLAMGQTISQGTTTNGWIKGSGHDFSQSKYTWSGGEICKPCHTPHNAVHPEVSGAIWAHTLSTNSYQTSFVADPTDGHNTAASTAALPADHRHEQQQVGETEVAQHPPRAHEPLQVTERRQVEIGVLPGQLAEGRQGATAS